MNEFKGTGDSLEEAVRSAHEQMEQHEADYTESEVVKWGAKIGGFANSVNYWVIVRQTR